MAAANQFNTFLGVQIAGNARAEVAAYEAMMNRAMGNIAENTARQQLQLQAQMSAGARAVAAPRGSVQAAQAQREVTRLAQEAAFEDAKRLQLAESRIGVLRRERSETENLISQQSRERAAALAHARAIRDQQRYFQKIGMPATGPGISNADIGTATARVAAAQQAINLARRNGSVVALELAEAEREIARAQLAAANSAKVAQAAQANLDAANIRATNYAEAGLERRRRLAEVTAIGKSNTAARAAANPYAAAQARFDEARRGSGLAAAVNAAGASASDGVTRVAGSLNQATREAGRFAEGLQGVGRGIGVIQGPLGPLAGRINAVSAAFRDFSGLGLGTALAAGTGFGIAKLANDYAEIENRLRPLFASQTQVNAAMADVVDISRDARTDLESTARLYQRLTVVGRELGLSQQRVAEQVELVTKATRLSGATGQEAAASITQFAQAIGSNRLGGDELRSLLENNLRLARAIAGGLGVTVGELRKLGTEGVLTANLVTDALSSQRAVIEEEFSRMPVTIGQAMQQVGTEFTVLAGNFNKAFPIVTGLANAIKFIADNLELLGASLVTAGAAYGVFRAQMVITAFVQQRTQIAGVVLALAQMSAAFPQTAAANAAMSAQLATSATVMGRARAAGAGLLGVLTSAPAVLGLMAGGLFLLAQRTTDSQRATELHSGALDRYSDLLDTATGKVRDLTEAEASRARLANVKDVEESRGLQVSAFQRAGRALRGTVGTFDTQAERQRILQLSTQIERGGQAGLRAIAVLDKMAISGDSAAKAARDAISAQVDTIDKADRTFRRVSKIENLLNGGTDPAAAAEQAERRELMLEAGAQRLTQLEKEAELTNTVNREANTLAKNLKEAYGAYNGKGGAIDPESLASRAKAIDRIARTPTATAEGRAELGKRVERQRELLAEDVQLQRQVQGAVEATAKAMTASELASYRQSQSSKETRDAERERKKELAEQRKIEAQRLRDEKEAERLSRDRMRNAEAYSRFMEGADGNVTAAEAVERQIRAMQIRAELTKKQAQSMKGYEEGDYVSNDEEGNAILVKRADILARERDLRASLLVPAADMVKAAQDELLLTQAVLQGRQAQFELERANAALIKQQGAGFGLSPAQQAALLASKAGTEAMAREKARGDELVRVYEQAAESIQKSFESLFDNIFENGIDSFNDLWKSVFSGFNGLRSRLLSAKVFGGMADQVRASVTGERQYSAAGDQAIIQNALKTIADATSATAQTSAAANDNTATVANNTAATAAATAAVGSGVGLAVKVLQTALGPDGAIMSGGQVGTRRPGAADIYNDIGLQFGKKLDALFGTQTGPLARDGAGTFGFLGSKLGTTLQGAGTGSMVAGGMKLLGIKSSSAGAQIGGAIGSAIPIPGADIALAVVGGFLGGMMKKTPRGYASFNIGSTGVDVTDTRGGGKGSRARIDAAREAAGGLGDFLNDIADRIGNGFLQGSFTGELGSRKKKFTYDATPGNKAGRLSFDTQEEAIEAATRDLISRGIIGGISAASQRILQSGQDLQKAIEKAAIIESIPKRLKALQNPMGAAIDELNAEFTNMRDVLVEAGASAEQFTQLQQLYDLERAKALETTAQKTQDVLTDWMNGLISGPSSPLGRREVLSNARTLYGQQVGTIGTAGFDQEAYREAADSLQSAARALYGSTPEFYNIFNDILANTRNAIGGLGATNVAAMPNVAASPFADPNWMKPVNDTLVQQVEATNNQTVVLANAINNLPQAIGDRLYERLTGNRGAINSLPGGGRNDGRMGLGGPIRDF